MQLAQFQSAFDSLPNITPLNITTSGWKNASIDCLRLDQVHPFISGNKWYKLKHHLQEAQQAGKKRVISFGGAYSNHLHALAYAGNELNIDTVGIVRGEPATTLSPTLQDCVDWGMTLEWLSRSDYRSVAPMQDHHSFQELQRFQEKYPDAWIVPEGGGGVEGRKGVEELFRALIHQGVMKYDYIVCPVGSGTTLAGIVSSAIPKAKCIGVSALKGAHDLEHRVEEMLVQSDASHSWEILHDFHFGGFAKMSERLKDFISDFYQEYEVLLDPVYTGKTLFAVQECLLQGRMNPGARILVVHTGGLQGWRGFGESWPGGIDNK